jgi:hypothetical protein
MHALPRGSEMDVSSGVGMGWGATGGGVSGAWGRTEGAGAREDVAMTAEARREVTAEDEGVKRGMSVGVGSAVSCRSSNGWPRFMRLGWTATACAAATKASVRTERARIAPKEPKPSVQESESVDASSPWPSGQKRCGEREVDCGHKVVERTKGQDDGLSKS